MRPILRLSILTLMALPALPAVAAERVALVIGMARYAHIAPLDNTANDARDLAATLQGIGFEVTLAIDEPGARMRELLHDFAFRAETAELALIYFAGHGVEVQGENFLVPVDADVASNRNVQRQALSLDQFLAAVDRARVMRVVILDSCRDNPFGDALAPQPATATGAPAPAAGRGAGAGGLAPAQPDRGTLVAFAARDGQVALDGEGDNSPFARALIEKLPQPGLEISLAFRQVRDRVLRDTGNLQEPYTYGSLSGVPFYLAGAGAAAPDGSDRIAAWSRLRPDEEQQLQVLADGGDTRSMLGLAYMRLNPAEDHYDPGSAVSYLQRAAEAGAPEAQFELAKLYERGVGVAEDPVKALALYRQSAEAGFADAINDLGFLHYQGGLGLLPDPQRALGFFERAADLRHPQAQFNFAALIDDGLVPSKGPADSAHYLYQALRTGSADVLRLLGDRPTMFSDATRKALQQQLRDHEFYAGTIDGDFGPGTQRGIRRAYGLSE